MSTVALIQGAVTLTPSVFALAPKRLSLLAFGPTVIVEEQPVKKRTATALVAINVFIYMFVLKLLMESNIIHLKRGVSTTFI